MGQRTFIKDLNNSARITTGNMGNNIELNQGSKIKTIDQEVELLGDETSKSIYIVLPKENYILENPNSTLMITYTNLFEENLQPDFLISESSK